MTPLERKALLVAKGVEMKDIAAFVGCSKARVTEVIHDRIVFETPTTRKIKNAIAERVGMVVSQIWPDVAGAEPTAGAA